MRRTFLVLVLSASVFAAACSSDDGGDASTTDSVAAPSTPVETTQAPETTPAPTAAVDTLPATDPVITDAAFEQVVPGGDCQCSDGSEFSFWVREANPDKVMFYFQGGGACFSAGTCGPESTSFKRQALGDDPNFLNTGIWDQTNAENPFTGWSVVYVPYCTGDVHVGDNTMDYGEGVVIQHKGNVNALAALDELVARFPDAEQVFVTGESAGGVPTPQMAGLVADELPDARVVALADSSGAYPDVPAVNAVIGSFWGNLNGVPDWPEFEGTTPEDWSIPGIFRFAGLHNPELVLARFNYVADSVQASFTALAGLDASDLGALIETNQTDVEADGVPIADWVAEGSSHTILSSPAVYTQAVGDRRFIDWLQDLVDGEPVEDVRCDVCG